MRAARGKNLTTLLHVKFCETGMIIWVQRFFLGGESASLKRRSKKRPKFGAISDEFRLWSRVSGTDGDIENGKSKWKLQPLSGSHVRRQKIGELRSTNKKVIAAHVDSPRGAVAAGAAGAAAPSPALAARGQRGAEKCPFAM